MGRCPLLIPLAALIAIILISDSLGLRRPAEPPVFSAATCSATVLTVKEAATAGYLAVAEIDSVDARAVSPFKARLHFLSETPEPMAECRVCFSGKIRPLPPCPVVPDIVDMQAGLRRQGVTATVAVAADSIRYMAPTRSLRYIFAKANGAVMMRLMQCNLSSRTIQVLAAVLLGRSEMIDADTRMHYSAAGLSHLLALSGMHVGIIAMIIAVALWPFYFGRHMRSRLVLTIAALWLYAALTAFIPSVTRAVIMASVYMLGRILERRASSFNSLCLAAIVILIVNPDDLYAIGFQLSFSAVAGIILFYPLINRVNRRNHPRLYALASYPALSVSAMILTGVVVMFHFHTFPLYFLAANLLAVPVMPLLVCAGIPALLFDIGAPADFLAELLDRIAAVTASLPGAVIDNLYPPAWFVIGLLAMLCGFAVAARVGSRFGMYEAAIVMAGLFLCLIVRPAVRYPEREEYVVPETGSTQRIVVANGTCTVLTDAATESERKEIEERYGILLRDFIGKRGLEAPVAKFEQDFLTE